MIANSSNLSTIMATLRQQRRILYITGVGIFILLVWHIINKPLTDSSLQGKTKYSRPSEEQTQQKLKPIHVRDYDYKIDLQQVGIIGNLNVIDVIEFMVMIVPREH